MTLSCTGLSVAYGRREALRSLDLALEPGRILALIGPNGSGKSTALHALAGLVAPSTGTVALDGRAVRAMRRRDLARRVAFLPQQPVAPEEMTVGRLALQGRFSHVGLLRAYRDADHAAVTWALASTGLTAFAERPLQELSGGERQRAWIAAALAQEADILLLDEPTSFLDIGHQVEVLDLLLRLRRERGTTIAIAIHDIDQALAIADRVALLAGGRLAFDGAPAALAASGLVEQVFGVRGRFVPIAPSGALHFDVPVGPRAARAADLPPEAGQPARRPNTT